MTAAIPPNEMPTHALAKRVEAIIRQLPAVELLDDENLACIRHALDRLRMLSVAAEAPAASDAHSAGMREGLLLGAAEQSAKDVALAERLLDALRSEHRIASLSLGPQPPRAGTHARHPRGPLVARVRRLFRG